jgi:pimeloyl-ACP methyl ester carboxylesterase
MIQVFLALALLVSPPTPGAANTSLERVTWSGTVELPGDQKLDFSVELEDGSGTISIPLQGAKDLPLTGVSVTEKKLEFGIASVGAAWVMDVADDGRTASGVLRQRGEFKTTMRRLADGEAAVKELVRPQEPKPPFPYDVSQVRFENAAADVKLAGTLTIPRGNGPFPCVVLVSGSGPQNRDEELMGHKPFLVLADHLTRNGVAVLRYDDRGVGQSKGVFATATSDDFAQDALAAIAFLKGRREIDAKHLCIVGHSEGGMIAPMCAVQSKDVAFIVLLAGTGMRGAELLALQAKLISVAAGMPADMAEERLKESGALYALVAAGKSDDEVKARMREVILRQLQTEPEMATSSAEERANKTDELVAQQSAELLSPWFRRFLAYDPRENLAKVTCPVLALNGEKDLQVPPRENLSLIEATLRAAGNADVTIVELPGLNHLFQTCTTGAPSEYALIEETFSPTALDVLTKWIRKRGGLDG